MQQSERKLHKMTDIVALVLKNVGLFLDAVDSSQRFLDFAAKGRINHKGIDRARGAVYVFLL